MDGECLINEVFSRPSLWQVRHKNYKNREVQEKLWEEVAVAVNSTKDKVRTRWKSMKDYYRTQLKGIKNTRSGGQLRKSTWPFFELLYFLKDEFPSTEITGNLDPQDFEYTQQFSESQTVKEEYIDELRDEGSPQTTPRCDTPITPCESSSSFRYRRKRKANVQAQVAQKILQLEKKKIQFLNSDKEEKCEDYHFLMSLLPYFKGMPPVQKLTVRNHITQVIIDSMNHQQQCVAFD